jgi:hypothetical protein
LSNAQDILDTLSHFRVMLAEEIQSQSDTKALLPQIQANINEICDRIFLSFYRITFHPHVLLTVVVLAASLRLRFPVPARFPIPRTARERFVVRISEMRAEAIPRGDLSDENLALCYAYTMMADQLADAFEASAVVLQGLFGIEHGEEFDIEIR